MLQLLAELPALAPNNPRKGEKDLSTLEILRAGNFTKAAQLLPGIVVG